MEREERGRRDIGRSRHVLVKGVDSVSPQRQAALISLTEIIRTPGKEQIADRGREPYIVGTSSKAEKIRAPIKNKKTDTHTR